MINRDTKSHVQSQNMAWHSVSPQPCIGVKLPIWGDIITLTHNIIINSLTCYPNNYVSRMDICKEITLPRKMISKVKMARTRKFNKKYRWITLSQYYYYSLKFLRVESKDRNHIKLRLDRKRRRTKIAEWPPPSVN